MADKPVAGSSKKLLLDVLAWMKTIRAEVNSGEATLTGRTQHTGQNLLERVWRAAEADTWPAPETDAGTAAGLTMALAISEAEDLLECAQPADNLESATDDDWYEQRRQWMLRNTFRPHELKAECAHEWRDAPCPENLNRMRCRLCGVTS